MTAKYTAFKKIFKKHNGLLRVSEVIQRGIPEHMVYEMFEKGELIKEARGLYRRADRDPLGNPDLVQVSLLVPNE
ncbi:MAG TPA: type IV toxin-antitoxin system AbiEi family antitoxin domain-containing protein [Anaerolineales bacterium]|nr:type IV toxin-antitoxin system AbiEi family antitoxin domain-containing protein [Anaerolineales bacterium]HLO28580.1 type IV toxin-antitoxin system AbiEi family antitoxin domain-containing protein [Anaerolineales bacterium]